MKRRNFLKAAALSIPALSIGSEKMDWFSIHEPIQKGPFLPNWQSLQQYKVPNWFRNAKFGIWAHWGPQCQPEAGDWYARGMYQEGSRQYKYHLAKYGHPSTFGFKDVINEWKAEKWNPEELVSLYKKAGAKYFVALANHHDNFDLYESRYQPDWNSLKIGPKKDILKLWEAAARKNDLPFGVSVHASHTWSWLEVAQRSDKTGSLAGVPYDGNLTKKDGKGKWWEGLDPQELYAQRHPLSENSNDDRMIHKQWNWGNAVAVPSKAYVEKFVNRTIECINKYNPDLLYFDDSQLPFWPISDAGLRIAAHFYNKSVKKSGNVNVVLNGKILDEQQRRSMVWDIERGQSNSIEPFVWQTDTCIGDWHYNRDVYTNRKYKTAKTVIQSLVDIVSKNGNLLLNIPVRGDGTIDEIERGVVEEIGAWMQVNSECIYDTRPAKLFGEGPAIEAAAALTAQGFNEGKGKPFTSSDIRFTQKGDFLYAIAMGWPDNGIINIKSIGQGKALQHKEITKVELLGGGNLRFENTADGLKIYLPDSAPQLSYANVFKMS